MRPLPTDFAEYRRRRRLARLVTLAVVLVAVALVQLLVLLMHAGEQRLAMIPYLGLVVLAAVGGFALVKVWRWSRRARPVVQSLEPTAGEIYGIPELDAPPDRHQGLSGEVKPPTRW